jgi:hypothetical protein
MDRFWRVDKALEDADGLGWIRERLGAFDWSKADWISVRRGRSEKYAFRGVCKAPRNGSGYRINCNVSKHASYPIHQLLRVSPLYRNPDGTWPEVPEGHKVGDRYVATRKGESVQWRRLYRPLELSSEDEVLVFLVAHEAFHYLRKTRQVGGTTRRDRSRRFRPEDIRAVSRRVEHRHTHRHAVVDRTVTGLRN